MFEDFLISLHGGSWFSFDETGVKSVDTYFSNGSVDIGDLANLSREDMETKFNLFVKNREIENARCAFNNAISNFLNNKAIELRYDNIMSARSYAGYENAFQEEALKLSKWASSCWVKAGEIEAEVMSGAISMPSIEEVVEMMPEYI